MRQPCLNPFLHSLDLLNHRHHSGPVFGFMEMKPLYMVASVLSRFNDYLKAERDDCSFILNEAVRRKTLPELFSFLAKMSFWHCAAWKSKLLLLLLRISWTPNCLHLCFRLDEGYEWLPRGGLWHARTAPSAGRGEGGSKKSEFKFLLGEIHTITVRWDKPMIVLHYSWCILQSLYIFGSVKQKFGVLKW